VKLCTFSNPDFFFDGFNQSNSEITF
jgi:hypothetical protein